ncbi:MAG: hypothetical protein U5K75_08355 [Ahrensia sp.]|nr:hypothetical protein [Ahrensia sp.]
MTRSATYDRIEDEKELEARHLEARQLICELIGCACCDAYSAADHYVAAELEFQKLNHKNENGE